MSASEPKSKVVINPGLIAALGHYGRAIPMMSYPAQQTAYLHTDAGNVKSMWTVWTTCAAAREILEDEELMRMKFECLKAGVRRWCGDSLYERIMGEKP